MLLDGVNHVAIITADMDRFQAFYLDVFEAEVAADFTERPGVRMSIVNIGPHTELNVFQIEGSAEAEHQVPMFGRGRIDHLGLQAGSKPAFDLIRDRLIERRANDGFVTDFGPILSLFFRDPDGLEGEVCVANPDGEPGVHHPPGTPAPGYHVVVS